MRGDVFFQLGYADRHFKLPIITTLVELQDDVSPDGDKRLFLIASNAFDEAVPLEKLTVSKSHAEDLLTLPELLRELSRLNTCVPPSFLESLGI